MRWLRPVVGVLAVGVLIAAVMSPSPSSSFACGGATPVADAGGWHTVGATLDPTQGQAPTYSDHGGMSFAELLVAGANAGLWQQDLSSVLGLANRSGFGMPMETELLIRMPGSAKVFKVWKNDVGSGQAGDPHYKVDLHPGIATALGWSGNQDVQVAVAQGGSGSTFVSNPVGATASCAATGLVSANGTSNPAPGATWGRLDMGFDGDYNMAEGPHAPYSGTIRGIGIGGWPGMGVYFAIQNDDQSGPDYTRAMYFAEGATPLFPNGTHVTAGQKIGDAVQSGGTSAPGNFEIGPANTSNFDCLAKSYGLGSSGSRGMVMSFYAYMRALGAGATSNPAAAGNH